LQPQRSRKNIKRFDVAIPINLKPIFKKLAPKEIDKRKSEN
jgi:hypothetical protein